MLGLKLNHVSKRGPRCQVNENRSDSEHSSDTPYFAFAGELVGACCDYWEENCPLQWRYNDQITSLAIVYSTAYSGAEQRKHQSPGSLAFVRGIHRWPMNTPHKEPVTRQLFPFDDVIIQCYNKSTILLITRYLSWKTIRASIFHL